MTIAEEAHVVNIIPPIDINGAGATSDYFSLKNYAHATILLTLGVTGAASTVTLEESDDNAGSTTTAIAFSYYAETTAAGDTLGARTAATTAGFATSTNDSITYVIEVDASQLTNGYPYLVLKMTDPTAATLASAVAILTGARFKQDGTPTAIT
jgi:hypothetical protein